MSPDPDRSRAVASSWAAAALLLAHAGLLARLQGPACIDDAYISFRYARNLVEGSGLVFNPGERVEGYTNFGWTLLLAVVEALDLSTPTVARLLSLLLAAALVLAAVRFAAARGEHGTAAAVLAGALLAADGSLARWSQEGMETVLFSLLLLAAAIRASRPAGRPPVWALLFAAASLVRPEGVLWFAATVLWWWPRLGRRRALAGIATYLAPLLPHLLWRWHYYGALLPNTFHAKVGAAPAQLVRGAEYVGRFLLLHRWPLLLLLAVALLSRRASPRAAWRPYFLMLAAVHMGAVALLGGDWMGPGRFLVPAVPLLYLAVADAAAPLLASRRRVRVGLPLTLSALLFLLTSWGAERRSILDERPYSASRLAVAGWLREHAARGDSLLTSEIGQLAYVSRLRTHDLHGLTDPHVARLRVPDMGAGRPGHEKADLAHSFSLRPTWVVFPGIAADYLARREEFPPYRDYEMFLLPETTALPDYQILLRRRAR